MIMPVSAAPYSAKPIFKGAIRRTELMEEVVSNFTKMEQKRWDAVTSAMEKTNDNLLFKISSVVDEIGKTIIKRLIINQEGKGTIAEEVYRVVKGGSVFMYDRESVKRTIIETFENLYNKKGEKN